MTDTAAFQDEYLRTWTEPDRDLRTTLVEQLWTPAGALAVSSLGITLHGAEEIAAHVSRVHDDLIAGKGLAFSYDQAVESGDALLLRWSMTAPGGQVVGRGADVVFLDAADRIERAYMFMGVA